MSAAAVGEALGALLAVPYRVVLVWLEVSPTTYGLALFPGVAAALALAHLLDRRLGRPAPLFPSPAPRSWRPGMVLDWWAWPFYAWGFVAALVAVGLSWADPAWLPAVLALAAVTYLQGAWRFRSRLFLLAAGALGQAAALAAIVAWGWLAYPT